MLVCDDDAHVYTRDVAWVMHSVSVAGLRWGSVIEECWHVYVHEPVFVRVDLVSSCPFSQPSLSVTRDSCHPTQRLPYCCCEAVMGEHYFWGHDVLRCLAEYSCIVWNTRVRPSDQLHRRHGAFQHEDGLRGQSVYIHTRLIS